MFNELHFSYDIYNVFELPFLKIKFNDFNSRKHVYKKLIKGKLLKFIFFFVLNKVIRFKLVH